MLIRQQSNKNWLILLYLYNLTAILVAFGPTKDGFFTGYFVDGYFYLL